MNPHYMHLYSDFVLCGSFCHYVKYTFVYLFNLYLDIIRYDLTTCPICFACQLQTKVKKIDLLFLSSSCFHPNKL